ncbi:MAG TPA: hypothetical protein PKY01_03655 [Candidatus Hydrogenedentes bacterium]|nr:hypothetical protein [Candidatus Hydrogenedentota bacterium]
MSERGSRSRGFATPAFQDAPNVYAALDAARCLSNSGMSIKTKADQVS